LFRKKIICYQNTKNISESVSDEIKESSSKEEITSSTGIPYSKLPETTSQDNKISTTTLKTTVIIMIENGF